MTDKPGGIRIAFTNEELGHALWGSMKAQGWATFNIWLEALARREGVEIAEISDEMCLAIAEDAFGLVLDEIPADNPLHGALSRYLAEDVPRRIASKRTGPDLKLV